MMHALSTFANQDAVPVSEACHEGLKLGLLFGLLAFQGPQQALASSDYASGMQSIPFIGASIGNLGDISTGFVSVRKSPCSCLCWHFNCCNTYIIIDAPSLMILSQYYNLHYPTSLIG